MSQRLRAGVIGAGSWAVAAHLPTLAARPEVEIVGICRQGPQLAAVAERFGVPVASADYRDVLALDLDLCVVASPSSVHYEHAAAALRSGAHVLCEKPMTIDPEQAWGLVAVAKEVDRQLLVSFGWNYSPLVRAAVDLVAGKIGTLESVAVHMQSSTRELLSNTGAYPESSPESQPEPGTWTDPMRSGGGYGQAQLSHALALAMALLPDLAVDSVYAVASSPLSAPVELHTSWTLALSGSGIGSVVGGSSHLGARGDKHQLDVRAIGSDGQFIVDVHRELVWLRGPDGREQTLALAPEAGRYRLNGPADALVDVGLGVAGANAAPGELGARTVEVLDAAYRSLRSGRPANCGG